MQENRVSERQGQVLGDLVEGSHRPGAERTPPRSAALTGRRFQRRAGETPVREQVMLPQERTQRPMAGLLSIGAAKAISLGFKSLPRNLGFRSRYAELVIKMGRRLRDLSRRRGRFSEYIYQHHYSVIPPVSQDEIPASARGEAVCIRFSGGMDSMLTASICAELFREVHLITFTARRGPEVEKTHRATEMLRSRYGASRFVHRIEEMGPLREKIYFEDYVPKFHPSNYYEVISVCPACVMAMHIETLAYCRRHAVPYATDGSTCEIGALRLAMQNPFVLESLRTFYGELGVRFFVNPAYRILRSDHALHDRGVIPVRDVKKTPLQKATQQQCYLPQLELLVSKLLGVCEDDYLALVPETADLVSLYFQQSLPGYLRYAEQRAAGSGLRECMELLLADRAA